MNEDFFVLNKICPKCGKEFTRTSKTQSWCKSCKNLARNKKYAEDKDYREKTIKSALNRQNKNREKYLAYQSSYRNINRIALSVAEGNRRNEKRSEINEGRRLDRKNNPEKYKIKAHLYWEKLKEDEEIYLTRKIKGHQRRSLKRESGFNSISEKAFISSLISWQLNRCVYCNKQLEDKSVDHVVPISKCGSHSERNIVLCCRSCNSKKHNFILGVEWNPEIIEICDPIIIDRPNYTVVSSFALSSRDYRNHNFLADLLVKSNKPIYFDWERLNRKLAIDNRLIVESVCDNKIFARNTSIIEVESTTAKTFFDLYHVQGFGPGNLYLGLEHNNELVGLTSWLERDNEIYLNRLAFKGKVLGGFSKLVFNFKKTYCDNKPIISFTDPRYTTGKSYENIGFAFLGLTDNPIYYYVNGTGLYHRSLYMKKNLPKILDFFDEKLTEEQNCFANGLYKLFGPKQKKWILKEG